jgi:hypothetical protein
MTQRAKLKTNVAPIASEFGENLARKWFGDDVVDEMPRYVRGDKKGQFKGWLKWTKVIEGGWQRTGPATAECDYNGRVLYPNQILNKWIEISIWGGEPEIVAAYSVQ